MALGQALRYVLQSSNFKIALLLLALLVHGKFLFAVFVANIIFVSYVLYKLFTLRLSPPIAKKVPKRFQFLLGPEWQRILLLQQVTAAELAIPIAPSVPQVAERLETLVALIVNNFIEGWYQNVSKSTLFPDSTKIELKSVLRKLQLRLADVNMPEFLVFRVIPLLTEHYKTFVACKNSHDALYSMESKLELFKSLDRESVHRGVSMTLPGQEARKQEKQYLRELVALVLPLLLSEEEAKSVIVVDLLREILSCTVLANLFEALSEADLLNQLVVNLIGSTLQRRKQVRRLRQALEEHTKHSSGPDLPKLPPLYPLTAGTVRIWKEKLEKNNSERELRYLLGVVEAAQAHLNSAEASVAETDRSILSQLAARIESVLGKETLSLTAVLADTKKKHAFREFLRGTKEEYFLDSWSDIEHMKAPLEDIELTEISLTLKFSNKDEIVSIYDKYINCEEGLVVPAELKEAVGAFVNSNSQDAELYSNARASLLKLQERIYSWLESDCYPRFQGSEGYSELKSNNTPRSLVSRRAPSLAFKNVSSADEYEPLVSSGVKISPAVVNAVECAFEKIMENSPNPEQRAAVFPSMDQETPGSGAHHGRLFASSNNSSDSLRDPQANRLSRLFEDHSDSDSEDTSFDSNDMQASANLSDSQLINLEILLAAPGDLKLEEQIKILDDDIDALSQQSEILESLIKKAELTNNLSELKILRRSIASLEKEISSKELQKEQYIVQENENSLFGKSSVRIQNCVLSSEDQHSYALYIIEVQKFSSENPSEIVAGWVVARRFSQFYKLHEYLKRKYPSVADLRFPKKAMPYSQFQKMHQIEVRKPILENYLRELLSNAKVCSNPVFRSFLSSEHFDVDRRDKNKSKDGIFNRFYLEFAPKAASLASSRPANPGVQNEEMLQNIKEMERELRQFDDLGKNYAGKQPFIKPIFDLILVLFNLGSKNWLRGRALLVILQQVLGSTIEKTATSAINGVFEQEQKIVSILDSLTSMLFPNGKFRDAPKPRTRAEQLATRQEAFSIFTVFMDETCSRIFGARHTSLASANILELMQNDYLNKSLLFKLLDVIFAEIFPEINFLT